jgi:hypothetical protein
LLRPLSVAFALAAVGGCGGSEKLTPAKGSAGMTASGGSGGSGGSAGDVDQAPAELVGDYVVSLTNGKNTCSTLADWTEGKESSGITITITQDGTMLTAQVGGEAAILFVLLTGDNNFSGEMHGNDFTLTSDGTKSTTSGNCTYTVNAVISGTLTGNAIHGTVTYEPAISDDPDCAPYDCQAEQAFSGSRPPPA